MNIMTTISRDQLTEQRKAWHERLTPYFFKLILNPGYINMEKELDLLKPLFLDTFDSVFAKDTYYWKPKLIFNNNKIPLFRGNVLIFELIEECGGNMHRVNEIVAKDPNRYLALSKNGVLNKYGHNYNGYVNSNFCPSGALAEHSLNTGFARPHHEFAKIAIPDGPEFQKFRESAQKMLEATEENHKAYQDWIGISSNTNLISFTNDDE